MNKTHTLAKFATSMRAASLIEDLTAKGIDATLNAPKWTNKKLPPPVVTVMIDAKDLDAAKVVYWRREALETHMSDTKTNLMPTAPEFIVIADWQAYLCYWRSTTPRPKVEPAFPQLYNSYVNVMKYTPVLAAYLKAEGIRYSTADYDDFR